LEFDRTPKKDLSDFTRFPLIGFSARFSSVLRLSQYLVIINAKSFFGMIANPVPSPKRKLKG
jgi:hypothetical protein